MVKLQHIEIDTRGKDDMVDISERVAEIVAGSGAVNGQALIFVEGSTGGLSTIEYEPGLIADFPALMDKLVPAGKTYCHDQTWHDGNGHAHLRATLIGPSLTVPFAQKRMLLGTWQQIVFLEFDIRPRRRRLAVQVAGE